jgi:hypothetical protein
MQLNLRRASGGVKIWADLNHLQVGRYGEYFAKMALVRAGFDVFSPEVDDKGIDFVLRIDGDTPRYHDVQVKTVRRTNYVFLRKDQFRRTPNLLLALVILDEGREPDMYLIPSRAWREAKPPFVDRDYDGKRSAPEYGLMLSPSTRSRWSCSASLGRYQHSHVIAPGYGQGMHQMSVGDGGSGRSRSPAQVHRGRA